MPLDAMHDRTVTLSGAPEQLADLASLLGAPTRLAILRELMAAPEPLHINELARRIGIDASPIRTHLEMLVRAGLVREVEGGLGRVRRFETFLKDARLTLEGVNRTERPRPRVGPPPREAARLEKKLAAIADDIKGLEEKARRVQAEIDAAWAKAEGRPAVR